MKIVLVPDSFKGCMTSGEAAGILGAAAEKYAAASCFYIPVADGGEGSTDCLLTALGGERVTVSVTSPEGVPCEACYGITARGSAVIEIAQSSGLTRQTAYRACEATTYGFGELLRSALDRGCRDFLLCLGGSATTDGGCGFAAALGIRFFDAAGRCFVPVGGTLEKIAGVDFSATDPRIAQSRFTVMSDVESPLYGPLGAAFVFAPQKGATPEEVRRLDAGLAHLGTLLTGLTGKNRVTAPGAGAAGGAGYGCMMFLQATVRSGIETLLDLTGFDALAAEADLIVTGEGRLDGQSLMGKVLSGVRRRSGGRPVVSFCGSCGLSETALKSYGVEAVEIGAGLPTEESVARGKELLALAAERYFSADRLKTKGRTQSTSVC